MPRKIIRRSKPLADEPVPSAPAPSPEPVPEKKTPGSPMALIAVLVLAGCVGIACLKYLPSSNKGATKASASAADQVSDLVKAVSKHIAVKSGENPMVALVQDPDSLREQNPVFYKEAQVGDRVLVWSDKAVLYSPSRDIVLAMAPLNAAPTQNSATSTSAVKTPSKDEVTLELRNGSGVPGLARKAADKLKADGWNVVTVTDAKIKEVKSSEVLVSKSESLGTLPADLAKIVSGSVVTALDGEPVSTADILVIIGSEYKPE